MYIARNNCSPGQLPDDVIRSILHKVPSIEMISCGWETVNHGFGQVVEEILRKRKRYDTTDEDNYAFFASLSQPIVSFKQLHILQQVSQKIFIHLTQLTIDIDSLKKVQLLPSASLSSLNSLKVIFGHPYSGSVPIYCETFQPLVDNCLSSASLSTISLDVTLSSGTLSWSLCEFRDLCRCLAERVTPQADWSITFHDETIDGQKWRSPVELCTNREQTVVCFLRAVEQLGIHIQSIRIMDKCKLSPYMMIGSITKRRSLYMWQEYKHCNHLYLEYDIGLISPNIGIPQGSNICLQSVHVEASHVLYKKDFLEYFRTVPTLQSLSIAAPLSFPRRVSQCVVGCFSSPDYACFRPDGWCQVHQILPNIEFHLLNSALPTVPQCNVDQFMDDGNFSVLCA